MRDSYYTNFIIDVEKNKVLMAIDYDLPVDSLRGALQFDGIEGVRVERVGPLSYGPLFETPGEWEPSSILNRVAY